MNSKETLFAGLAGLRGSVSLILAQAVVTEDEGGDEVSQVSLLLVILNNVSHHEYLQDSMPQSALINQHLHLAGPCGVATQLQKPS